MKDFKTCKRCSGSGKYIGLITGYNTTAGFTYSSHGQEYQPYAYDCKECNGKGYIDPNEEILVQRKFIKDDFWSQQ